MGASFSRFKGRHCLGLLTVLSLCLQLLYVAAVRQAVYAAVVPDIASITFSTMKATGASGYDGITIGVRIRNFTDATSYKAIIHRADGSSAVREGESGVLSLINAGGVLSLTTPINFNGDSAGQYYGDQNAIWNSDTRPVRITVEIMTATYGLITASTPDGQALVETKGLYQDLIDTTLPTVGVTSDGIPVTSGAIVDAGSLLKIEFFDIHLARLEILSGGVKVLEWSDVDKSVINERHLDGYALGDGKYIIRAIDRSGLFSDDFEINIVGAINLPTESIDLSGIYRNGGESVMAVARRREPVVFAGNGGGAVSGEVSFLDSKGEFEEEQSRQLGSEYTAGEKIAATDSEELLSNTQDTSRALVAGVVFVAAVTIVVFWYKGKLI